MISCTERASCIFQCYPFRVNIRFIISIWYALNDKVFHSRFLMFIWAVLHIFILCILLLLLCSKSRLSARLKHCFFFRHFSLLLALAFVCSLFRWLCCCIACTRFPFSLFVSLCLWSGVPFTFTSGWDFN